MNQAIRLATPNAATMGTAKIRGVPRIPEKISDRIVVGSRVAADTCIEEEEDDVIAVAVDSPAVVYREAVAGSMCSLVLEGINIVVEAIGEVLIDLAQKASHPPGGSMQRTTTQRNNIRKAIVPLCDDIEGIIVVEAIFLMQRAKHFC